MIIIAISIGLQAASSYDYTSDGISTSELSRTLFGTLTIPKGCLILNLLQVVRFTGFTMDLFRESVLESSAYQIEFDPSLVAISLLHGSA